MGGAYSRLVSWDAHLFEQLIHQRYGTVAEAARQLGLSAQGLRTFFPSNGPQHAEIRAKIQEAFPEDADRLWAAPGRQAADPDVARLEAKVDAILAALGGSAQPDATQAVEEAAKRRRGRTAQPQPSAGSRRGRVDSAAS